MAPSFFSVYCQVGITLRHEDFSAGNLIVAVDIPKDRSVNREFTGQFAGWCLVLSNGILRENSTFITRGWKD